VLTHTLTEGTQDDAHGLTDIMVPRFNLTESSSTLQLIKVPQGITLPTCNTCIHSKQHRVPVRKGPAHHSGIPMEVIHLDLCSRNFTSIGGKLYFMSFVDNATRYAQVALLHTKDEAKEKPQAFLAVLQPDQKVRTFQTDSGKEYVNRDVEALLKQQGIELHKSPTYTPQFNGVAEWFNRTIIEMVQTMLLDFNLSCGFWAKALQLAVHIYNWTLHKANGGKSPYFAQTGKQPKLDKYLHPFGPKVYTKIQMKQNKLLPKSRPGRYMEPADTTSSYRIYVPDTNSVTCT